MSESESKAMEVDKENIEPIKPIKAKDEKIEKAEDDEIEIDLSEFTEDKIFNDMIKCIEDKELSTSNSKKHFRKVLEKKYNLKKKSFKRHKPFDIACAKIAEKYPANNPQQEEKENENPPKQSAAEEEEEYKREINGKKSKKKTENNDENDENKKKKRKKKSRKRKLPSDENDDDNEMSDPPKKKRKTNSGESVNDEFKEKKSKTTNRKKKKSAPGEWTLKKLKKLLKVTHLANPKVYSEMKGKSVKKQVEFVQNILQENNVDYSKLNEQSIKKIQREYALKKEMEDLGIDINNNEINKNEGRSKRKRTKISYNDAKSDRSGSESEEMAVAMKEDGRESSDEQYEPDYDAEDSDEEYGDSD